MKKGNKYIRDAVSGLFIAKDRGTTPDIEKAQPIAEDPRWNSQRVLLFLARFLKMKDPFVYEKPSEDSKEEE